jgi:hypothetical protein
VGGKQTIGTFGDKHSKRSRNRDSGQWTRLTIRLPESAYTILFVHCQVNNPVAGHFDFIKAKRMSSETENTINE